MFHSAEYATLPPALLKTTGPRMNLCPLYYQQKAASLPLCFLLLKTNQTKSGQTERKRESNGEIELGWDEGGGLGAAFGPSFTLSALLAGDSVQDLLITTQWSSNPTDLIDSNCCLGLAALPNPPSMPSLPLYFSQSLFPLPSISHKPLICMTARGPLWRWDAGRIGGTGVGALSVCAHKEEGP